MKAPFGMASPAPYLERNKEIVASSNLLIACPVGDKEELRSGTWSTVRFARKICTELVIVYP